MVFVHCLQAAESLSPCNVLYASAIERSVLDIAFAHVARAISPEHLRLKEGGSMRFGVEVNIELISLARFEKVADLGTSSASSTSTACGR